MDKQQQSGGRTALEVFLWIFGSVVVIGVILSWILIYFVGGFFAGQYRGAVDAEDNLRISRDAATEVLAGKTYLEQATALSGEEERGSISAIIPQRAYENPQGFAEEMEQIVSSGKISSINLKFVEGKLLKVDIPDNSHVSRETTTNEVTSQHEFLSEQGWKDLLDITQISAVEQLKVSPEGELKITITEGVDNNQVTTEIKSSAASHQELKAVENIETPQGINRVLIEEEFTAVNVSNNPYSVRMSVEPQDSARAFHAISNIGKQPWPHGVQRVEITSESSSEGANPTLHLTMVTGPYANIFSQRDAEKGRAATYKALEPSVRALGGELEPPYLLEIKAEQQTNQTVSQEPLLSIKK